LQAVIRPQKALVASNQCHPMQVVKPLLRARPIFWQTQPQGRARFSGRSEKAGAMPTLADKRTGAIRAAGGDSGV
jgi:hypothetical protein